MNDIELISLMRRDGTVLATLPGENDCFCTGLFLEPFMILEAWSIPEVESVFTEAETLLGEGCHIAGFISYEASPAFDREQKVLPDGQFPLLRLACYRKSPERIRLPYRNDFVLKTAFIPELRKEEYTARINKIHENIVAGNIYQANLTFRSEAPPVHNPEQLFLNLQTRHPVPYAAYLNLCGLKILSLSPELYLETMDGRHVSSSPMKGTAKRSPIPERDRKIVENLAADPKNLAENLMITDMVRNDLGRICKRDSISVDPLFHVDTYNTVHQMISTVHGGLKDNIGLFELFKATFPPASITGAPKISAMKVISENEKSPRRVYTGTVGCICPDRTFRFNVAIRTLTCYHDRVETGVGGGIVYDSGADSEWQEALLKCRYATYALPDFQVFETMRWTKREGFVLLDEHIRRAETSQVYFRRRFIPGAVEEALERMCPELESNPAYRDGACVKFLLEYNGRVKVELTPPRKPEWRGLGLRLLLASERTDSDNVFLYHKTTNRNFYDTRYQAVRQSGFHEMLFLNRKGELTEGTVSNVFARKGTRWFTPELECGLLPGIWRRRQIEILNAEEKVLFPADLMDADEIRIGNSLRGTGVAAYLENEEDHRCLFTGSPV